MEKKKRYLCYGNEFERKDDAKVSSYWHLHNFISSYCQRRFSQIANMYMKLWCKMAILSISKRISMFNRRIQLSQEIQHTTGFLISIWIMFTYTICCCCWAIRRTFRARSVWRYLTQVISHEAVSCGRAKMRNNIHKGELIFVRTRGYRRWPIVAYLVMAVRPSNSIGLQVLQ